MVAVARDLVARQAGAMADMVEELFPGMRHQLAEDPFAMLESRRDLIVRLMPEGQTRSAAAVPSCSVAGVYVDDENPPVLAVAAAASAGRRAFTLLHEFGRRCSAAGRSCWSLHR
jgi:hypothetical protein